MRRRLVVARRELASLRSEKTIVLAVAIQLFVAAFSSFLVVGLVALYDPSATGDAVRVEIGVSGNATPELAPVVEEDPAREVTTYESFDAALAAFRQGRVDAVLHGVERPAGNVSVIAVAPEGNFRTTLVVVQLTDTLEALERTRRADLSHRLERKPVPIPDAGGGSDYVGFTYTVLVPLLVFMPAFIAGSVAVDSLTEELERGTMELLRATPLSLGAIVDGKALATAGLVPLQAGAWLLLLGLNGVPVAHPLPAVLLAAAAGVLLVAVGAALSLTVPERRSSQLLYSLATLGLFGAAMLLPESPPNAVAKLAVGSPTATTHLIVAGAALAAVAGYAAARALVVRAGAPE